MLRAPRATLRSVGASARERGQTTVGNKDHGGVDTLQVTLAEELAAAFPREAQSVGKSLEKLGFEVAK